MKKFLFDLDGTLVNSFSLMPYWETNEGIDYIIKNKPAIIPYHQVASIIQRLHKDKKAIIATNGRDIYARSIIEQLGLPSDIPIYSALGKPRPEKLKEILTEHGIAPEDALMVGDSGIDILAAHGCSMPSLAVTWGYNTKEQLAKAEPSAIIENESELVSIIDAFENNEIGYTKRKNPENYQKFFELSSKSPEIIEIVLGPYYKTGHSKFYESKSNEILRFKNARHRSWEELKNGARNEFFHKGRLIRKEKYLDIINSFYQELIKRISELNLTENSLVIAAPNSVPEYCYRTDVNNLMAFNLNKQFKKENRERFMFRFNVKPESHLADGARKESIHYETMGIKSRLPENLDNILIFDEVSTTGNQIRAIAKILRKLNFNGNIYSLILGKTQ